ncbi:MAG TPA: hypothetical protein VFL93_02580, partial [Longimicrobiaceae bacterium]|nr:hypothetical protein [Longimicrobiaceae bacterium]
DVPDYALVMGNPARPRGWMSRHGHRLRDPDSDGVMICPESGLRYRLESDTLVCMDLDEDEALPVAMGTGRIGYRDLVHRGDPGL